MLSTKPDIISSLVLYKIRKGFDGSQKAMIVENYSVRRSKLEEMVSFMHLNHLESSERKPKAQQVSRNVEFCKPS